MKYAVFSSIRSFSTQYETDALPGENVEQYLTRMMAKGNLQPNQPQKMITAKLLELQRRLVDIENSNWPRPQIVVHDPNGDSRASSTSNGFFGRFFGGNSDLEVKKPSIAGGADLAVRHIYKPSIKGIYIHGGVGQGKTMLMDAFYETCQIKSKTRVHFHEFLQRVHQEIHKIKQKGPSDDVLIDVAKLMAAEAKLICFDEMHVVHITDAMILKRLFEGLFQEGCVVVATSNKEPSELYKGGLNRIRFLPFIDLLNDCCETASLQSGKDFRLSKLSSAGATIFNSPARSNAEIEKHAIYVTNSAPLDRGSVDIAVGRSIDVERMAEGVALFDFEELCDRNIGTSEFLGIGSHFHTIFIRNIPSLTNLDDMRNQVRRFINLIDILYEKHTRVVFDAELPAFRLFGTTKLTDDFQKLRLSAQKFHPNLASFLDKLPTNPTGKDDVASAISVSAGLDIETSLCIANALDRNQDGIVDCAKDEIGGCLYFHVCNYDGKAPSAFGPNFDAGWWEGSEHYKEQAGYELYNEGGSTPVDDNSFAFVRTVSRIREMGSVPYLKDHQKMHRNSLHHGNDLHLFGVKE